MSAIRWNTIALFHDLGPEEINQINLAFLDGEPAREDSADQGHGHILPGIHVRCAAHDAQRLGFADVHRTH